MFDVAVRYRLASSQKEWVSSCVWEVWSAMFGETICGVYPSCGRSVISLFLSSSSMIGDSHAEELSHATMFAIVHDSADPCLTPHS